MLYVERSKLQKLLRFPVRLIELSFGALYEENKKFEDRIPLMEAHFEILERESQGIYRNLGVSEESMKFMIRHIQNIYLNPDSSGFIRPNLLSERNQRAYLGIRDDALKLVSQCS